MILKEFCFYLESVVPLSYQEGYDNSGLQVGTPEKEIKSALITLDVTPVVLDEAVGKGCDLIVSHHPVIFNGIKRITGSTFTEKILQKAIKEDIAIYSAHTNLDVISTGVSMKMAEKLNLQELRVLSPLKDRLLKLVTFIPEDYFKKVTSALFEAGAGVTGGYDQCGFNTSGEGSFRPGEKSSPFVGNRGELNFEKEIRFETILFSHLKDKVVKALLKTHPYEEVAYDIYKLENTNTREGMGCVGELSEPLASGHFLQIIASVLNARGIRYSKPLDKMVKRVALCGGSGFSLLNAAISSGADAFITSDIKYHNFFDAEDKILLVDAGHFESEIFSTEILYDLIIKKFPKFAVRFSETNTNPINYL
jgi:dinuclear metal center YbgI/SA1388 family protein